MEDAECLISLHLGRLDQGEFGRRTGLISKCLNVRVSIVRTLRKVFFFPTFDERYKKTEKLSNYQHLDDEIMWQIAGKLKTKQSQVQIPRNFNGTLGVESSIGKQFKVTGSTEKKPW